MNGTGPGCRATAEEPCAYALRPTLMEGRAMFRIYEWNFSATAEAVVGVLLALTMIVAVFV